MELPEDAPFVLRHEQERQRRIALLELPHIQPLTAYTEQIRCQAGKEDKLPYFDPCDGGIHAKALFLLEAPGPKAIGSTFVSRNNPDQTARNLCELMQQANIPRSATAIWNIVPWHIGDEKHIRPVNSLDLAEAQPHLKDLLLLFWDLRVIILCGKKAQRAETYLSKVKSVPIIKTYHMSPCVFNRSPDKKEQTQEMFRHIAKRLAAQR